MATERVDDILELIDTGLAAAELLIPGQAHSVEDSVWRDLYESYQSGSIETLEEAQDRYSAWQQQWRGQGRHIGRRAIDQS